MIQITIFNMGLGNDAKKQKNHWDWKMLHKHLKKIFLILK